MNAFRLANFSTPLRTMRSQRPGRFNTLEDPPTQYLADHPLTPWAEFLRWSPGSDLGESTARVWTLQVPLDDLAELTFDNASSDHGIAPERLIADDDYSDCQDLATQLRDLGAGGMIVPNAALPGTRSVVLFGSYVMTGYLNESPDPEQLPGAMTADHGRPPREMSALTRPIGAAHGAYEAWVAGAPYTFPEPILCRYP